MKELKSWRPAAQRECVCGARYWPKQGWAHEKCTAVAVKPCRRCGKPARSRGAWYCEECFVGSKPAKVEYAVTRAVRRGELRPAKECVCVDCGAQAQHYDHRDYNKPTEVEPVCASCNYKRGPAIKYSAEKAG